jgi:hypothetical protein
MGDRLPAEPVRPAAPLPQDRPLTSAPGPVPATGKTAAAGSGDLVVRATAPTQPPPPTLPSTPEPPPSAKTPGDLEKAKQLHGQAAAKFAGVTDYIARFRRREVINGRAMPPDNLYFRSRKEPFSVYFKWLEGTEHEGREILFVKGQNKGMMQVKTGKGDPFPGMTISMDPRSERATANSRRTVDEAGIGNMIDRFGVVLVALEKGTREYGTLQYAGQQQRPESPYPMECVIQQVPAGLEKYLPRGGTRSWFFCGDPRVKEYQLPNLVVTQDETGREVEYYHFDRMNTNVCRPEDFDAATLFAKR